MSNWLSAAKLLPPSTQISVRPTPQRIGIWRHCAQPPTRIPREAINISISRCYFLRTQRYLRCWGDESRTNSCYTIVEERPSLIRLYFCSHRSIGWRHARPWCSSCASILFFCITGYNLSLRACTLVFMGWRWSRWRHRHVGGGAGSWWNRLPSGGNNSSGYCSSSGASHGGVRRSIYT